MPRSERTSAGGLGGGVGALDTAGLFLQFRQIDRLQCQQSGTVKYAAHPRQPAQPSGDE